ncbi:kinase-like domain-containing protein [Mycena capillaripes]|nr:kinase-like domain-containing protein [Mycena capillaripes]
MCVSIHSTLSQFFLQFKINGDNQCYVAKKVVDVGKGPGVDVTSSANKLILGRDLVRLKRLEYFKNNFLNHASKKGFGELADFSISDGFMIVATDISTSEDTTEDNTEDDGDAYLVEPLRATSVVNKFTGTFSASRDTDKLTSTILAFNHFVIEDTACLLAFADLQGEHLSFLGSMVLFDPMTHTISGTSGTGDHGPKGIRETINDHNCNLFCKALDLSSVDILLESLDARITENENRLVSHQSSVAGS